MVNISKVLALVGFGAAFAFSSTANAATVRCEFTSWRGAQTEQVAISWVGVGFEVQEERSRLRVLYQGGVSDWMSVDVRKTSRFSTFVVNLNERDSSGAQFNTRYGFRVYNTGRCETRHEDGVHLPIIGEGRVQ